MIDGKRLSLPSNDKGENGDEKLPLKDDETELRTIRELEEDLGEKIYQGISLADLL